VGKIKPEWVQANEVLRMRVGGGWGCHSGEELALQVPMDAGASVRPEDPPMKRGWKG